MILTVQKLFHHVSHTLFKFHLDPKTTNFGPTPTVPYIEDAYEISVIFISRPLLSLLLAAAGNPGFTAGRGFNPAGGALGGG
ncbi:hypothetical protein F511_15487 [Dorcoceras hygrometricum]|uniref:Uncharacterized protein n=1 Tax=Dorcoceras hygrometricum TaxID=472368 RepID=A0A2Z7CPY2_9LAMI|nr:hypothetical protein F511_15487 [Dorcoceras hygrometricum]